MDVISTTGSTKMVNFLSNYCRSCSTICENMTPLQAFNADQNSEQLLTFFNIKVLILKLSKDLNLSNHGQVQSYVVLP